MKKFLTALTLMLVCLPISLMAQSNLALEYMNDGKYLQAVEVLESAREKGNTNLSDLVNLSYCYILLHDYTKAEAVYAEVIKDKKAEPKQFFFYGELSRINGKYLEAKQWYGEFLKTYPDDRIAKLRIHSCDSLIFWSSSSTGITTENVSTINTPDDETCPYAESGKAEMVWVTNSREQFKRCNVETQFVSPQLSFILGMNPENKAFRPFSDSVSYSYFSASHGTRAVVIKTVKKTPDGEVYGAPVIMISTKDHRFSEFRPAGIPAGYVCNHPCLAQNGERIYFAGNMPGGVGGVDLWYSDLKDGVWLAPVNLGSAVNTPGDDMFPWVSADEKQLYFASDGHPGYGNLDVYCTVWQNGQWSSPRNMQAPVNSIGNDFSFSFAEQYAGYFVSNRYQGAKGRNDVYRFHLPEPKIVPVDTVKPPVVLTVPADTAMLFFRTASAKIDPVFEENLQRVAAMLKEKSYLKLNVYAWADERGTDAVNTRLCTERATAVRDWMISRGIDEKRIILQPEGVTSDKAVVCNNYHVRIGYMPGNGYTEVYEKNIHQRARVQCLKYGAGYVYVAGEGTKAAMNTLRREIRDKYGIEGYVTASWNGYHMEETRYSPCRRALMYFSK